MKRTFGACVHKIRRVSALACALAALSTHASTASADSQKVREVTLVAPSPGTAEVAVATSGTPRFGARVSDGGMRIVLDIEDAEVDGAAAAITKGNLVVAGVMTQTFQRGTGHATRLLIQLAHPAEYRVRSSAEGLRVDLQLADKTGPMPNVAKALGAPAATVIAGPQGVVRVNDVRFDRQGAVERVIVELTGAVTYEPTGAAAGHAAIELAGVALPDSLQRKLDVSAFGGSVRAVSTYRRQGDPSRVVLDVERGDGLKGTVTREGNDLVFSFMSGPMPSTMSGIAADGGAARRTRTVGREKPVDAGPKIETAFPASSAGDMQVEKQEPDQADAFMPGSVLAQQRRFGGRRIDLDLKDAPIQEVLRLISEVGRVNIVAGDNVSGNVTIRVRNVPWDQALETVLQAKGYGMVRQGNMIRVAPLAELNKERELAVARRKSELALAPIETRLVPVSYAEAKEVQERAKEMLSPRGTISVDERTNMLIIRDVAGNLNQIEELVRSLDTQTPEVLIEARIVEATSTYLRDVGIQWGGDGSASAATGNPTGLAFPNSVGVVGGASDTTTPTAGLSPFSNTVSNPNFAVNLPATVGTGQGGALGLTFGSVDNTVNLAVRLSAAESSGMLRIISSPRVLTLDNRNAKINQGTLIPFSQISAQGVQTTFQEAKLQLLVKPHVTAEGSVAMHVKINRDEPDFNQTSARGDPTILKREAETDLLIMDGHTAVIGGIFTRNTGRNLNQVPFFGDIPILGVLFQRRRASDTRGELVIFLTPRIVNRAEALGR
jgi:type IV pilus assembly protein PilQ